MASGVTHAIAGISIATCFYRRSVPRSVWVVGTVCAILPDVDATFSAFGVERGSLLGHRGLTHSLLFAAVLAALIVRVGYATGVPGLGRRALWSYLFLSMASHGFLDAFTNGGTGIAFFSPLSNHRYFFPWRPVEVSPLSIIRFFSARGLTILISEATWIWPPAALLALSAILWRRMHHPPADAAAP